MTEFKSGMFYNEPKLDYLSKSDELVEARIANKDIWAVIASKVFKLPYEECTEFFTNGTPNNDGKLRRQVCKTAATNIACPDYYKDNPNGITRCYPVEVKEAETCIKELCGL